MKRTTRDEAGYIKLLDQHAGMLSRIAAMYSRTPDDKSDLSQELRVQLWRAFPSYDESRNEKTWVYRVALNAAIGWFRKASRWNPVEFELDSVPNRETTPTESLLLQQLISQLDPLGRALLTLHLDELSNEEIATVMGISPQNVATKLTRIRQRLRTIASGETHE